MLIASAATVAVSTNGLAAIARLNNTHAAGRAMQKARERSFMVRSPHVSYGAGETWAFLVAGYAAATNADPTQLQQ